jgi:hypothetical protein
MNHTNKLRPLPENRMITTGSSVTKPAQYAHYYIEDVIPAIKFGIFQNTSLRRRIEEIRTESNPEIARNLKKGLPYFTGSYFEESRKDTNVQFAAFAIIDIDHVADIEGVKKLAMDKLPCARCAFRSVNDGVKIVVTLDPVITEESLYRSTYEELRQKVQSITGLTPDTTSDWSRACFFSYDPNLINNNDCGGYACENPPAHSHASPPPQKRSLPSSAEAIAATGDDYVKAEIVIQALCKTVIKYPDWIKIGLALKAAFGESGKALWMLFEGNPNYNDDHHELERKWRSFSSSGAVGLGSLFYIGEMYGICL